MNDPGSTMSLSRGAMDKLREQLHMFHRRGGKDPMPEVEDVSRPAADARQHVFGLLEHALGGAEQQRRIQVALDGTVEADLLPGLVDRNPPVGADDVAAGLP